MQRLTFSLLWAFFSSVCICLGVANDMALARAYGLTFLIINRYTLELDAFLD